MLGMSAHSLLFLGYELEMNVNTDFRRPTTPYYDRDYVFTIGNNVATLESYNRLRQRVAESGVGSAAVAAAVMSTSNFLQHFVFSFAHRQVHAAGGVSHRTHP